MSVNYNFVSAIFGRPRKIFFVFENFGEVVPNPWDARASGGYLSSRRP